MKKIIFLCILLSGFIKLQAQNVTILPGGITPNPAGNYPRLAYSAILALPSPQQGDLAFDTTNKCVRVYIDGKWVCTYQNPDSFPAAVSVISAGGAGEDRGAGIALDASGNIYITGTYTGNTVFGNVLNMSAGETDIFVIKYNSNGVFQWVKSAGGPLEDYVESIAVDVNGNVFVTGYYQDEAKFATGIFKTSEGGLDVFVIKYNTSGVFQWVQSAGGPDNDTGAGVAADASGNVYVVGSYESTAAFGATNKTVQGNNDIFIAKYNTGGTLQWVESAGGTGFDNGNDIAIDVNNKLYITGSFSGTTNFGTINRTSAGQNDIYVAKFDPSTSTWTYAVAVGGTNGENGKSIVVDASGNAYITGSFDGNVTFGSSNLSSQGAGDIFVAKCNNAGVFQWVQSGGSSATDAGQDIAIDANGNVYITGAISGIANFGSVTRTPEGTNDIFIAKYNNGGTLQWVKSIGNEGYDYGQGIVVDAINNVYVTGHYSGTVLFDKIIKVSKGSSDAFVIRLDK